MQTEAEGKQEAEVDTSSSNPPAANAPASNVPAAITSNPGNAAPVSQPGETAPAAPNGGAPAQFPPPKTDKPRPHICGTCTRSFARLEHLKRHERSHTKEKPFECGDCTRCFARRDLLLRHQQKLHMTNPATRGPKGGRRESVSGAGVGGGAKVRKNSVANANVGGLASNTMRPRANTISDIASLGLYDSGFPGLSRVSSAAAAGSLHPAHMVRGGMQAHMGFDFHGMPNPLGHLGTMHGLPKLDTNINAADVSTNLRTAPPQATFAELDIEQLYAPHTTINPAALHFGSAASIAPPNMTMSAFEMGGNRPMSMDDDYAWMRNWNMQYQNGFENEQAIDESSPSRMSSGDSPGDYSDNLMNGNMRVPARNGMQWQQPDPSPQPNMHPATFPVDGLASGLTNLDATAGTVSPSHLHEPTSTADAYFHPAMMQHNGQQQQSHQRQSPLLHTPPPPTHQQQQHDQLYPQQLQSLVAAGQPDMLPAHNPQYVGQALSNFGSDSPSISSSSMTGSARQSSVTSMSTDSITDSTRQALLTSLSQPSMFSAQNTRKFSVPNIGSPLSPSNARMAVSNQGPTLPSTADIKRYVGAFVRHAHPHLPVVHVPTLSFDTIEMAVSPQGSSPTAQLNQPAGNGGARCLILGMAAIGALYEYDHPASKELFEAAKKMISLYLEERRRAELSSVGNGGPAGPSGESPLWLVQAMLLAVIYGHHCGDRTLADIASNHIAALLSLARAANLHDSSREHESGSNGRAQSAGADAAADVGAPEPSPLQGAELHAQWHAWKLKEERKRVVYAIFILSSLLTTAYNQAPTIMNSEIKFNLPCSEELYNAESAEEWQTRGGLNEERNAISFASALSTLLTASQRQSASTHFGNGGSDHRSDGEGHADSDLRPSTYGCLVLINALHNYIWETRNRHHGKKWTAQETEAMFAHIEPALNAWQAAWKSNPHHKLERPNPFGLGPLSADSIPLLDLAFVRLFVNFGRIAEAFWNRDFDAMADELSKGSDMQAITGADENGNLDCSTGLNGHSASQSDPTSQGRTASDAISRRERYFRKAAFYAADAMTVACNYNLTYTDAIAHELPIQSAICFFDCAQVLGEWLTAVQERVGQYLGIVGRDHIDYTSVPAIMMLETEDVELLQKVEQICASLEAKRQQHENLSMLSMDINNFGAHSGPLPTRSSVDLTSCGLGIRIMRSTALMLEKAVIWPITHVMAKALEVESTHMERRTEASIQS